MAYHVVKYIMCAEFWGTSIIAAPSHKFWGGRVLPDPTPVICAYGGLVLQRLCCISGENLRLAKLRHFLVVAVLCFLTVSQFCLYFACLQCFDTVGWVAGRASSL